MNTSTIADMLRADPSIADDIAGFCKQMNERKNRRVVKQHVEIIDKEELYSFADTCGGECTEADVLAAMKIIDIEPLLMEAKERQAKVESAIACGDCVTIEDAIAKFSEGGK